MKLTILSERLAVCRLSANDPFPVWAHSGSLLAIVRTTDELSVVCEEKFVPGDVRAEIGWCAFKVIGPLDFSTVGILSSLSTALAQAGVSIFSISTYDTDYILVKHDCLSEAINALQQAGCTIQY